MQLIVVSNRGRRYQVTVRGRGVLALSVIAAVVLAAAGGAGRGDGAVASAASAAHRESMRRELVEQEARVADLQREFDSRLAALASRAGELDARAARLDALGARLAKMAGLDAQEFDFTAPPGVGGPAPKGDDGAPDAEAIGAALGRLLQRLDRQEGRLAALQSLLLSRQLHQAAMPSGRPVRSGWLSSPFGNRLDPINGHREFHRGVDFAGRKGSEVVAVAPGVVVWSGRRSGYGQMVEIAHGNGYVTRYAHNARNLVKVAQRVEKGQTIALMGSSGRSTGPHVHFEVLHNGRAVNPARYIRSASTH